jgi:hypothetical protein
LDLHARDVGLDGTISMYILAQNAGVDSDGVCSLANCTCIIILGGTVNLDVLAGDISMRVGTVNRNMLARGIGMDLVTLGN